MDNVKWETQFIYYNEIWDVEIVVFPVVEGWGFRFVSYPHTEYETTETWSMNIWDTSDYAKQAALETFEAMYP